MHRDRTLMLTLAITGGIGSGKSQVSRYFESRGLPVYDFDSHAKRLYETHPELVDRLEECFRTGLRTEDGALDRKKLAALAFADSEALEKLESIVHPAVLRDFLDWRAEREAQGYTVVACESAIIMQKPLFRGLADKVLLVDATVETRLGRILSRDRCTREEALRRMSSQHFENEKFDFVIDNSSDLAGLYAAADAVLAGFKE